MDGEWWRGRLWRAIQFNIEDPYGFYADRVTADLLVEAAKRVKANMLIVFARDAWGRVFYGGSRLYPRHHNSRLDVAELVDKARSAGIRVVVMADHTANRHLYRLHPGWAQRNRDGEVIVLEHYPVREKVRDPHWPLICLNSPAMERYFVPEAREALEATGADGLLLDSFRYLPDPPKACYCGYCRARLRSEKGLELPERDDPEDESFRAAWEWRYDVVVRAIARLREAVKSVKRDALFFYNSHPAGWAGRGNVVVDRARDYLDAVFAEASETDVMGLHMVPVAVKLSRAMIGWGKPVFVTRNLFYNLRTVQSPPPPVIRQGVRLIAASGGHPVATMFSSQFFEDPRALDYLAGVYEELDRVEEFIVGSEPLRYAAIIFDTDTHEKRYWSEPHFYVSEVEGFALMHIHSHIPWEILSMRDLDRLSEYKVVVAAATAIVDDDEEEMLRGFVESGGFLVATHEFGVMRRDYTYTYRFALSDALGLRYEGVFYLGYAYLHLAGDEEDAKELWNGLPEAVVFGDFSTAFTRERTDPRMGELVRALPAGARVLAWGRLGRSAYGYEYTLGRSTPPPGPVLRFAGISLGGAGEGRTLYYAVRLGAHYSRLGHPDYAQLYLRPLHRYAPEPPAGSNAPDTVYIDYYRKNDSLIIHLVNLTVNERILAATTGPSKQSLPPFTPQYSVHPARSLVETPPFKVWIRTEWDRVKAFDAVTGEELKASVSGGRSDIVVPGLREYRLIVVTPRS